MSKKRAASTGRMRDVRPALDERCGGACELCGKGLGVLPDGSFVFDAHHRVQRSLGGDDSLENLAALCRPCHRFVHEAGDHWLLHPRGPSEDLPRF